MIVHQTILSSGAKNFRMNIQRGGSWDFHFHKNLEVLYVIEGMVSCTVGDKTELLHAGEFGMCLSNEIHAGGAVGEAFFWTCIFSEDYVQSFASFTKGKEGDTFKFICRDAVKRYFEHVFLHTEEKDFYTRKSCLYALCGEYLNCVTLTDKAKNKSEITTAIIDFISQNYKNDIRLADVAALLNYDYHYASRLFHKLFNMSFHDFVNIYRLEKAMELMAQGEKKLLDIAYESGFGSVRTFNSCFKAHYGSNPTEYKNALNTV